MAGKAVESRWTLKDLFTPKVKDATGAVNQFRSALNKADVAGKTFSKTQSAEAAVLLKHKAAMKEGKRAVQDMKSSLNGMLPILGIGAAAAFGKAVMSAQKFQDQMSQVGTLLNETGSKGSARLSQLSDQIMATSRESGTSLSDLSSGMYQVISAFGDTADAAKQLQIADMAATAGNSTVSDSVSLLSSIMKGYGDTSVAMEQKVSDLAFQTVKLGKTTYPELASSMGKVTATAKLMGVSVEELFATQATLAVSLGGSSQVSVDTAAALKALMGPSAQMKASMDKLGYSSGQAMIKALGFKGALKALVDSADGNTAALTKMFGRQNAVNLALSLAGASSKTYDENLKAMQHSVGATDRAYAAATNTLQHKWKVALNDVITGVIGVINKFHILQGLSAVLGGFSQHFRAIGTAVIGVVTVFGSYVAITRTAKAVTLAYTLATKLMKVETVAATEATTIAKIGMLAMNAVMAVSPIGWISIALGALAIAALWVGNHFQTTKLLLMDAWNGITKATQWAVNRGIDLVNIYLRYYKFVFDSIKFAGIAIWDGIIVAAQIGINTLLKLISPLGGLLKHVGINIPASVNFSGAMFKATAPKWDTSFGLHHVNFSGAEFSSSKLAEQRTKAQAEWGKTMNAHTKALHENSKALSSHKNSTNANTDSLNANTSASKSNTKALANGSGGNMSGEAIADALMPRLERHLYGTA